MHIDEHLDAAAAAEAKRRGISKAELIRHAVARELDGSPAAEDDPWDAMIGWLDDEPVDDIDEVVYGPRE